MSNLRKKFHSGVATTWLELLPYTALATCKSKFRLNGVTLMAFDPGYGLDAEPDVICAPPEVTTWWEQTRLGNADEMSHTVLSLGPMTCPRDWVTVASSVKDQISTLAMCCPPQVINASKSSSFVVIKELFAAGGTFLPVQCSTRSLGNASLS